jgi:hypothetical protein
MPRRAINDWFPYLDQVIVLWTEIGEDLKVGDMTLANLRTLRANLQTTLDSLNALQTQMGLKMGERDQEVSEIEEFAVQFRGAVLGRFGPDAIQYRRVPKVDARRASTRSDEPEAAKT